MHILCHIYFFLRKFYIAFIVSFIETVWNMNFAKLPQSHRFLWDSEELTFLNNIHIQNAQFCENSCILVFWTLAIVDYKTIFQTLFSVCVFVSREFRPVIKEHCFFVPMFENTIRLFLLVFTTFYRDNSYQKVYLYTRKL